MSMIKNKKIYELVLNQLNKNRISQINVKQNSNFFVGLILNSNRTYSRLIIKKENISYLNKTIQQQTTRFQSTESNTGANHNNNNNNNNNQVAKKSKFFSKTFKYAISILFGAGLGLVTGYYLLLDESVLIDDNEAVRSFVPKKEFKATRLIEGKNSKYENFPLKLHLFQFNSCPYCTQIRNYLDYFGFSYYLTEVDGYSKKEIATFTKARQLPILVLEDKLTNSRWHLANATAILSALESLRNEKHINFSELLQLYLPTLKNNSVHNTINPFKYQVNNSDLNSIEWRRWINNNAIPAFKLNSISTFKDLFELFDHYSEKSSWDLRYNKLFDRYKYYYLYYSHAYKAYKEYPKILDQLDNGLTPREILHNTAKKWEDGLAERNFIGDNKPNLADLSMYGAINAYEGCALFRELIAKHPRLRAWYDRMRLSIENGFENSKLNSRLSLESIKDLEPIVVIEDNKIEKKTQSSEEITPKIAQPPASPSSDNNNNNSKLHQFRLLSITYLIHVIVFAYAAMNK